MNLIETPNLPAGTVTAVIIDGRIPREIKAALERLKIAIIPTEAHPDVYAAVAFHPDIMLHHIGGDVLVYAPGTPEQFLDTLRERGFRLFQGNTVLGDKYPMTVAYNVARVGNYAIHNTKYTDPVIRELLASKGVEFIHTNQGYSKCLTCVVNSNSIITSDHDIHRRVCAAGLDSLLIEPDESIRLEPFSMGFFGGATGMIGKNKLAIAGDLHFHKNYHKIMDFLSLKRVDVVMLNDGKLMDIGTIIPVEQNRQYNL